MLSYATLRLCSRSVRRSGISSARNDPYDPHAIRGLKPVIFSDELVVGHDKMAFLAYR